MIRPEQGAAGAAASANRAPVTLTALPLVVAEELGNVVWHRRSVSIERSRTQAVLVQYTGHGHGVHFYRMKPSVALSLPRRGVLAYKLLDGVPAN